MEGKSTSEIVKVDVSNQEHQFPLKKKLILVKKLRIIFNSWQIVEEKLHLLQMKDSDVSVIQYLQKNLPLNSMMLKYITCLSPLLRSCNWSVEAIGRLASLILHLISKREVSIVNDQWRLYWLEKIDENWISDPKTDKMCQIDFFWSKVFTVMSSNRERKYKLLSKVVNSFISFPNGNANVERSLSDNKSTLRTNKLIWKKGLMALRRAKEYAWDHGGAHNVDTYRKD